MAIDRLLQAFRQLSASVQVVHSALLAARTKLVLYGTRGMRENVENHQMLPGICICMLCSFCERSKILNNQMLVCCKSSLDV